MYASVETPIPGALRGGRLEKPTSGKMGHATAHMTMDVYADAMDWAEAASESLTTASAGSPEPAL